MSIWSFYNGCGLSLDLLIDIRYKYCSLEIFSCLIWNCILSLFFFLSSFLLQFNMIIAIMQPPNTSLLHFLYRQQLQVLLLKLPLPLSKVKLLAHYRHHRVVVVILFRLLELFNFIFLHLIINIIQCNHFILFYIIFIGIYT